MPAASDFYNVAGINGDVVTLVAGLEQVLQINFNSFVARSIRRCVCVGRLLRHLLRCGRWGYVGICAAARCIRAKLQACAAHDQDFVAGVFGKTFGHGKHLEDGFRAADLEDARFFNGADNGNGMALDGGDENADVRIFHIRAAA